MPNWSVSEPDLESVCSDHPSPLDALAAGDVPALVLRNAFPRAACERLVTKLIDTELLFDPHQPIPEKFSQEAIPEGYFREGRGTGGGKVWQNATASGRTRIDIGTSLGYRGSNQDEFFAEKALEAKLKQALVEAKVVKFKDHDEGMAKLEGGEIDAYAGDQIVLIGLGRNVADPNTMALTPELFTYEPYGLMVRRDDADFRLAANRALVQLYRSGEIGQIYNKWFGDWGGRPSRLLLAMYALNSLPD